MHRSTRSLARIADPVIKVSRGGTQLVSTTAFGVSANLALALAHEDSPIEEDGSSRPPSSVRPISATMSLYTLGHPKLRLG